MHILLTDVVTCPRCGPEFGLIVLADRMEDRHILEGRLGCANCREAYEIRAGVVDLRWPRGAAARGAPGPTPAADAERAYRLAALMGITGPAGPAAVVTEDPALVEAVQGHLSHVVVFGVSDEAPAGGGEAGGGWTLVADRLPFRSRSLGGVAICSSDPDRHLGEALRCLAPGARLVVDPVGPGTAEALRRHDAHLLLEQDGVAVASASAAG